MTDEITLTIPREPGFEGVAHLVMSGLAVRLNLTIENLEDLQIALETLLDTTDDGGDLTVSMRIDNGELRTIVGPLTPRLLDAIAADVGEGGLGLRRVLETTVDDVFVDGDHVTLTKKVTQVDSFSVSSGPAGGAEPEGTVRSSTGPEGSVPAAEPGGGGAGLRPAGADAGEGSENG